MGWLQLLRKFRFVTWVYAYLINMIVCCSFTDWLHVKTTFFIYLQLLPCSGRFSKAGLQRDHPCWAFLGEWLVSIKDLSWFGDRYCSIVQAPPWCILQNCSKSSCQEISFSGDTAVKQWSWQYWRCKSYYGTSTFKDSIWQVLLFHWTISKWKFGQ